MMPEITIKISMQEDNSVTVKQMTDSATRVTSDSFSIEPPKLDEISDDWDVSIPIPESYDAELDFESDLPTLPEDKQVSIDWSSSIPELPDGEVESTDYEIDLPPVPEEE